ncbi:MAG: hypothetical protein NTW03_02290, partial [Verrucomicrobia bacterium]|nr:hypothetical protein [Verrucomicrobiota bacterium]
MKRNGSLMLAGLLLAPLTALHAATLTLSAPLEYQVIQRTSRDKGTLRIAGKLSEGATAKPVIEARMVLAGREGAWHKLPCVFNGDTFEAVTEMPAGGWHRLEVRALDGEAVLAQDGVEHVGMGEVFIVTGQSNSANHGEEKQNTETGRVAAFDGRRWQPAHDPQPGASGQGGSFMPPLGDALVRRFGVPVGFMACGIGATSVREWLPKGARFPNPPTLERRVQKLPGGEWESKGEAFASLVARLKQAGPRGFRAVLWHQGESDANQKDPTRTLPGRLYREYRAALIRESRREIGWDAPWFVAQASYHVTGDEASPDIRAAQASLWKEGLAMEGP